eukprot:4950400-Amphidinium_carterae.2
MQHADDVARSFVLFGPENQPGHSAEGTHQSSAEAAQPITVPAPQEPSAAERELHNLTHMPFRSWCEICVKSRSIIQLDYTFLRHQ